MDFAERIREFAARIPGQLDHIKTEEATKSALIMPFISALGYNVFDPAEVTPELVADVGTKKGEKVDYAILRDGRPTMLFECKQHGANLDRVTPTQLYRYFSVTEASFGILTNGLVYRFFSDLESENRLDSKPFLEVNLLALDDFAVGELKRFTKSAFNESEILATATDLRYTREIKRLLAQEFNQPSEAFVRFLTTRVYEGRLTQGVREQFSGIAKRAIQQFVIERISDRLKAAAEAEAHAAGEESEAVEPEATGERVEPETTPDEVQAFYIVKAILSQVTNVKRIAMRDQKTYCSVLLDNNNRKPICRFWFNSRQKYLGVFDQAKSETRHPLQDLDEIYAFGSQLVGAVRRYERD